MTSRICSTSWSVSWATRRSSGIPTFAMISLAFLGPIPWIYCSAITTRLLVGMLTPAMRATVIHSCCRRALKTPGGRSSRSRFANDNATPSPLPGARYRSNSRFGCGLLMDSPAFRQPLLAIPFACGASPPGGGARSGFGGFGLDFRGFSRRFALGFGGWARPARSLVIVTDAGGARLRRLDGLPPARPVGLGARFHGRCLLRSRLGGRRRLGRRPFQQMIDDLRDLRDRSHAVDRPQHALQLVIGHERGGLASIGQEAAMQHVRIVVGAQALPARLGLGDALLDALEQVRLVNLQLDHGVELEVLLLEHAIERMRLRHRARESIEDEAVMRIGLLDALGDDGHD